jgi:hypothetical protein
MTLEQLRKPFTQRPCLTGALLWTAFSLVAVLLRGVRWDENYEFAQVILGQISYPEGHPLFQYVRGFYSLQTYSLAALMYFFPEPLPANLLRNWAFLAASTVPVYLLGTLFARRQLVGHVAVVFVLLQIHTSFYSTYPVLVWPMIFSNGAIGLGYMLLALWALLDRRYRFAGLLLGLAPAVHLGQFPPLLIVAVLQSLWLLRKGQSRDVLNLIRFAMPGLAVSVLFALFLRWFAVASPVDGPYFSPVAPELLWRTFMERYAGHRAIPWTTGHIVLLGAVLLAVGLLAARRSDAGRSDKTQGPLLENPWTWSLLYCAIASCLVWFIMAVHYVMGPDIPYLLVGWLPYRLMNHVAPILIPLLVAIGYTREDRMPAWISAALLAALLTPLADLAMEREMIAKYLDNGEYLLFYLFGGTMGTGIVLAYRKQTAFVAVASIAIAAMISALACFHQYGAACTLAGVTAACIPMPGAVTARGLRFAGAGLGSLIVLAMLAREAEGRQHLYKSEFHQIVTSLLAEEGEPEAMILVHHDQAGDQMLFGHPVMADMATMLHGVYRPAIAPSVNAIFQDFYGIYLDPAAPRPDPPLAWHEVWPSFSLETWQQLSAKYGVAYVAAPSFMRLPLELLVRDDQRNFYHIPPAVEIETPRAPLVR